MEPDAARVGEAAERDKTVELNVGEAADVLGLTTASLRERIKRGTHPGRVGANGFYLASVGVEDLRRSGVALSPRGAAEVEGVKPGTIKKRCRDGVYPNARNDGLGWSIPATDLF
jgi:hypothetical protein